MKIAIAQLNPLIGDLPGNAQLILQAAEQAVAAGAELLLTPELALCGYPPKDLLIEPSFIAAMQQQLAQLARQLPPQLTALVGTVEPNTKGGGNPLFNSLALLAGGKVQQTFHKRLLPTYDVFDEDRYFEPGTQPNLLNLPGSSLRIGVTICEDLWNDELFWPKRLYTIDPLADLARQGIDLMINASASPFSVGKQHLREEMLQHAARRYGQPIIYINQVGGNDDLIFDGCSVAVNRQGEIVARGKAFSSNLLILEWDSDRQDLLKSNITPLPKSESAEIWSALVLGVRDYAAKCNFSKAVIGLSGGIDSAVVAAIATAALGAENVLGVLMPSPYSSDHSLSDALALAANLGIQTQTLAIADLMATYNQTLAPLFAGTASGIAEENIQARIRGNLLMAIANKFGYLLISTGNKSEMAVGYCTLYGDMSGGLAAIADVPKTKVYAICKWLNEQATGNRQQATVTESAALTLPDSLPFTCPEVIPVNILIKAPSAELKPGQMDQDSLPPYEILDDILDRLIEQHQSLEEMISGGHDPVVVQRVIQMVHRAEFKRRQAAPGLKVTQRAFGSGWRMPIAARPTLSLAK